MEKQDGKPGQAVMDHDRLFKELLSTFFVDFLEWFFPEVAASVDHDSIEFLDKEIFTDVTAGSRREADLVARTQIKDQSSCFLIHVEHQAQPQPEFAARMYSYFARLHEKYAIPIYPIAVFSYEQPNRTEDSAFRIQACGLDVLSFQFRVVQLNQLNWRDFVDRTDPLVAALMSRMRIDSADRPAAKIACLRMLARLQIDPAREALISGFVDSYLRLTMKERETFEFELRNTSPNEQERIMQIVTSWMEEGIEQGIQQGLEKGKAEGKHSEALTLVARQLVAKNLAAQTSELESQIGHLSLTQLEQLAEALLNFNHQSDLTKWLELNS